MKAMRSAKTGVEATLMVFGALVVTGLGIVAGIGCLVLVRATRDRVS